MSDKIGRINEGQYLAFKKLHNTCPSNLFTSFLSDLKLFRILFSHASKNNHINYYVPCSLNSSSGRQMETCLFFFR